MSANTAQSQTKSAVTVALDWWNYWSAETKPGETSRKGTFAQLKRCKNLEEILFTAAYQNFYRKLKAAGWRDQEGIAALAGCLANIKEKAEKPSLVEHFARLREGSENPLVSEKRFMRVVKIKTHAELYPALLRLIHLSGNSAPLPDLIRSVYYWNDKTRREWTFRYFAALPEDKVKGKK